MVYLIENFNSVMSCSGCFNAPCRWRVSWTSGECGGWLVVRVKWWDGGAGVEKRSAHGRWGGAGEGQRQAEGRGGVHLARG